jgi:hypothetical protein
LLRQCAIILRMIPSEYICTPIRAGAGGRHDFVPPTLLGTTMIELAWMWVRYQPASALSGWFRQRVGSERGRIRRISIVALARKLLMLT